MKLCLQAEAERRLGQAKRAAPAGRAGPSPSKRQRAAAMSSDEELSDQDGEPESNADPGVFSNDACCLVHLSTRKVEDAWYLT